MIKKGRKEISLKLRAISLLSRREYSRFELGRKLSYYTPSVGKVDQKIVEILNQLEEEGYLDDKRYVEVVLHGWKRKYGTARIISNLKNQNISQGILETVKKELEVTEFERAQEIYWRKFGFCDTSSDFLETKRNTLDELKSLRDTYRDRANFLIRRGFGFEIISSVLKKNLGSFDCYD